MNVSIIGMGRFGKLLYKQLDTLFAGEISLTSYDIQLVDEKLFQSVSFKQAVSSDVVIFAVPISNLEETLDKAAELINPDALAVDVCSVKVMPVKWMSEKLPKTVQIVGTHPMFGPDSVRANGDSIQGLPFVVTPFRLSPHNESLIMELVSRLGVEGFEMTPEEHDKKQAYSQIYTHLIGRLGERMGLKSTGIDTKGFTQLLKVQQYVVNDSLQLFKDMNKYNPFAKEMRAKVNSELKKIESELLSP